MCFMHAVCIPGYDMADRLKMAVDPLHEEGHQEYATVHAGAHVF